MTSINGYRLGRKIGTGGMGVVYEAEQLHPRRMVALKVLRADLITPRLSRRLEQEAEILGRLRHPGIAQIHEAGWFDSDEGRQPYFAMEIVSGEPIDVYARARHLSLAGRIELLARVCEAVDYAHGEGIVHRDLKPDNIIIDEHGQPKILDFGLARTTEADVQTLTTCRDLGDVLGTIPYMSPEQTVGDSSGIDTRSDIYALGVLGYQLLTGRLPHEPEGMSVLDYLCVIQDDIPPPAWEFNPRCRGDISTILGKALMKERELRYASAAEMAADLRRYLEHQPIRARPPGVVYRTVKFARRNRVLVFGVCATFIAMTTGIIGTSVQARRADLRAREAEAARAQSERFRERAEGEQYLANIRLAGIATRDEQLDTAEQALLLAPEKLRRWEWGYLWRRSHHELAILKGHRHRVRCVAFNHAGTRLLSMADDGEARLWDAASGEELAVMPGHTARIGHGCFSPDDRWIATASDDFTARIRTADGAGVHILSGHAKSINRIRFSPDSTRVLTTSDDGTARIWDVATGETLHVLSGHDDAVYESDWHPGGRWVATTSDDRTGRLWDSETGRQVAFLDGHGDEVNTVRFNPAGTSLVTIAEDSTGWIWKLRESESGEAPRLSRVPLDLMSLRLPRWAAYDPDGNRIVVAGRLGEVGIWNADTGAVLAPRMPRAIEVEDLALGHKGHYLALATKEFTVKLLVADEYIARGSEGLTFRGHKDFVTSLDFHPSADLFASGSTDGTVRIWPCSQDELTRRETSIRGNFITAEFTPDGRVFLVVEDQGWMLLDPLTMKITESGGEAGVVFTGGAFHPRTMRLVTTSDSEPARVRSIPDDVVRAELTDLVARPESLRFSPDGRTILTAGPANDCSLWSAASGERLRRFPGHEENVIWAVFDATGKFVITAGEDETMVIWDAGSGGLLRRVELESSVTYISAHPARPLVATASRDNRIGIWSIPDGERIRWFPAEHSRIDAVLVFTHGGDRLVVGDSRGKTAFWDWEGGGELLGVAMPGGRVRSLTFSPGGRFLLSAGDASHLRLLDGGLQPYGPDSPHAPGAFETVDYNCRLEPAFSGTRPGLVPPDLAEGGWEAPRPRGPVRTGH